jgi:aminopeptidase N
MKKIVIFLLFICTASFSQKTHFSKQDSLRGSITPERVWWNLTHYDLSIEVFPNKKYLKGKNSISYEVLAGSQIMQIDLQKPMKINKITQNNIEQRFRRNGNIYLVQLSKKQNIGNSYSIEIYFEGKPLEAKNAPWDAAITWSKDSSGNHFIATSCQGEGASMWWPCKDHMYDEPDLGMNINVTTPSNLMDVSNGQLINTTENKNNTTTWHWRVKNPINNYGVNINIADYSHFSEIYNGLKGELKLDYYVLKENLTKAKTHFSDTKRMLEAFEHWFGPYPFYEDGFKLVEVPYLGMEHQSSVTYGNEYKKGYLGRDLSGTGWGLKFDFIIIHEAGHEWFANSITYKDIADMWIHESFTNYSESLFLEYHYGKEAASEYVIGCRKNIRNDKPIIGKYDVNYPGSGDMYSKGANMLHTLRQLIENDALWLSILRGLNKEFYHQTVTTKQIEAYLSKRTNIDLTEFFNQYLRDIRIPKIEYKLESNKLIFRYVDIVENFDMPVLAKINNIEKWVFPNADWKEISMKDDIYFFEIDEDFYVKSQKVN